MNKLVFTLIFALFLAFTGVAMAEEGDWSDNIQHVESISTINGVALFWILVFFVVVTHPKIQERLFPGADDEIRVLGKNKEGEPLTEGDMVILKNYGERMKWRYVLIIVYLVLIFSASIPGGLF